MYAFFYFVNIIISDNYVLKVTETVTVVQCAMRVHE